MEPWQEATKRFTEHVESCVVCRLAAISYRPTNDRESYCEVGVELALTAAGLAGYGPRQNLAADDK